MSGPTSSVLTVWMPTSAPHTVQASPAEANVVGVVTLGTLTQSGGSQTKPWRLTIPGSLKPREAK